MIPYNRSKIRKTSYEQPSSKESKQIIQLLYFTYISLPVLINGIVASGKLVVLHFINCEIRYFKIVPNRMNKQSHIVLSVYIFNTVESHTIYNSTSTSWRGSGMCCDVLNELPSKFKELLITELFRGLESVSHSFQKADIINQGFREHSQQEPRMQPGEEVVEPEGNAQVSSGAGGWPWAVGIRTWASGARCQHVGYFPACHMLYSANSVCGICDQTLITKYIANVQQKQEHFKKTEHLSTMLHLVSSYSSQLSPPPHFFFFFFCSLTHSLLQTYRQREASTSESPIHDRLQAPCLREVPAQALLPGE